MVLTKLSVQVLSRSYLFMKHIVSPGYNRGVFEKNMPYIFEGKISVSGSTRSSIGHDDHIRRLFNPLCVGLRTSSGERVRRAYIPDTI